MIGDNLILLDKIDSTNNYIKNHWRELPSETVVWALEQTEGYGRNNKRWYSPLGGLWFSVLFKPRKRPLIPYFYLRMYSLVIYNVLKKKYKLDPIIKWPNDILLNSKKVCGILGESVYEDGTPSCVIVGVGINVNNELPEKVSNNSIALKDVIGKEIPLRKLLNELNHVAYHRYYLKYFKPKAISSITKMWLNHLNVKVGDKVQVSVENNGNIYGTVNEIQSDYLEIIDNNGEIRKINSGELIVL
ncbi:MAG: BirA family transcriptional regulator [Petrotoga sp.]|jgi:BirA family biotin operon repressor/biotin-[acetyl-CoA-carboxylase] ligase|nr:BirA family transcriptional regulator [Petrotoga sp.]